MTNSSNDPPDLPPGVRDLDDLGNRAGAALRQPAPTNGPTSAMQRGRQIRTRRLLIGSVAVSAVAIGGFAVLNRDNATGEQQAPVAAQPGPAAVAATTTTEPPATTVGATTTTTTTTTVVVVPGSEIAAAAILPAASFGASWADSDWPVPIYSGELAATVPSCAEFLGTFFESADRPVDTDAHQYLNQATFGQAGMYVQVLPTEADATAVMAVVNDPGFPKCWADFASQSVVVRPNAIAAASYVGAIDPQLVLAGDQAVAIAIEGPLTTDSGVSFPDAAVTPIVRVGRAIFTLNFSTQDLPTDQVVERVQEIVDRLRAVQT
jgi:hypothetical protein